MSDLIKSRETITLILKNMRAALNIIEQLELTAAKHDVRYQQTFTIIAEKELAGVRKFAEKLTNEINSDNLYPTYYSNFLNYCVAQIQQFITAGNEQRNTASDWINLNKSTIIKLNRAFKDLGQAEGAIQSGLQNRQKMMGALSD